MNTILEGYQSDEQIARQLDCSVRNVRRIRKTQPDAPSYIIVRRRPYSKPEEWRAFFERRMRTPNPTRA